MGIFTVFPTLLIYYFFSEEKKHEYIVVIHICGTHPSDVDWMKHL